MYEERQSEQEATCAKATAQNTQLGRTGILGSLSLKTPEDPGIRYLPKTMSTVPNRETLGTPHLGTLDLYRGLWSEAWRKREVLFAYGMYATICCLCM